MYCSETPITDRMRSIISAAERLKPIAYGALRKAGKQPSLPQHSTTSTTPSPLLCLPTPDPITRTLINFGCPSTTAGSLSDSFLRSVEQFRTACLSAHSQLMRQFASDPDRFSLPLQNAISRLECQYRDQVVATEQGVINQFIRHHKHHSNEGQRSKTKPTFNQEFVPFLEKYFEYNAYPSAPDRIMLAKKTMMTTRQIEVWFQNHRNRSKKEGRILRRLSNDPLPAQISFETIETRMPFFVIPESQRKLSVSGEPPHIDLRSEKIEDDSSSLLFSSKAPPHAYPTVYPPSCSYEPFPVRGGRLHIPAPVWARKPATSRPLRTTPDLDDLITDFAAKLVIRGSSQPQNSSISIIPWFAATYTTPPTAPHPASIQTMPVNSNNLPFMPLSSTLALHPHLDTFQSPGPALESMTPILPLQRARSVCRKIACLPRRTLKTNGLSHNANPSFLDPPSPSRPLSASSRSSSFSSVSSSGRRTSCSNSSSSLISTPVFDAMPLPDETSPLFISGLDTQDEDLFDDSIVRKFSLHHDTKQGYLRSQTSGVQIQS